MESEIRETPVWTERLKICSYDVDATQRLTSVSLCRHFLEAAWNHAEALGVGFAHLGQQGKVWVLSRLRIEVDRHPVWGDAATLRTWPRSTVGAIARRDFEVVDEGGSVVAAGSSAWLVLDLASRRPQRLNRILSGLDGIAGRAALDRDPEKLGVPAVWDTTVTVRVRYTDIDVNRHVNSSRYLGWILDAYPAGFHEQHSLRSLEINYLAETVQDETVTIRTRHERPGVGDHSLARETGVEVCRARLEWVPRTPIVTGTPPPADPARTVPSATPSEAIGKSATSNSNEARPQTGEALGRGWFDALGSTRLAGLRRAL
jgi:acyl-ACP thioesterase